MASDETTGIQSVEHLLREMTAVVQKTKAVVAALEAATASAVASAATRRQSEWHGLADNTEAQTGIGVLVVRVEAEKIAVELRSGWSAEEVAR